ncbi:MAG: phosphatase PAP2 family protein [Pseudomonadota bacterium]
MDMAVATPRLRGLHLMLNGAAFGICYPLANFLAQQQQVQRHFTLPFDTALPFLPWMVLPYLSSSLFFVLSFALVDSVQALRVLSRRLLLATLAATLVFIFYPLQFEMPRPEIASPPLDWLFELLSAIDRPYNQLPSLHVAYVFIFWASLSPIVRQPLRRALLAGWLLLVALATVFTYQHHLADAAGGAVLGALAIKLVRPDNAQRNGVAFHYAILAGIAWQIGWLLLRHPFAVYLCGSLLLVSLAYFRGNRHFLHKRRGAYPPWIWLLYGPYLAGYMLTWQLVRLRERGKPPFQQWSTQLWVGRRLTGDEAARLPPGCAVIDLANELSETPGLRGGSYQHIPLLDLHVPDDGAVREVLAAIARQTAQGRTVYLHCAMGYHRSHMLAQRYSEQIQA